MNRRSFFGMAAAAPVALASGFVAAEAKPVSSVASAKVLDEAFSKVRFRPGAVKLGSLQVDGLTTIDDNAVRVEIQGDRLVFSNKGRRVELPIEK